MISIYPAAQTTDFVRDVGDGLIRFSYGGFGENGYPSDNAPFAPIEIKATLARVQATLPLGWIGNYDILCLGVQLAQLDTDGKPNGNVDGERFTGFIALSVKRDVDLFRLLTHELMHEWFERRTPAEQAQFYELAGLTPGARTDEDWAKRPQELQAEHMRVALFGGPIDERMQRLPDATYARLRAWVKFRTPDEPSEVATVNTEAKRFEFVIGDFVAVVDGTPTQIDPSNPLVVPVIIEGRTMLPLRFIAEALGFDVQWDGAANKVTMTRK